MAAAAYTSGTHVRSASWPQDTHPLTKSIQNHLFLLKQTPESSSSCRKLGILNNLYEVVNEFLCFQTTSCHEAFTDLEDVSDGFLKTLDICRITRDVLMEVKEQVRELESNLRRRSKREREIDAYVWKRRELSKRVFRELKKTEESKKKKKMQKDSGEESLMKKVEEKSFEVMVCLLLDVVRDQRKRSGEAGRRLVWKMLFQWRNQEEEEEEEEIYEMSLKKLQETEEEIEETEKELESVYKKMMKTRVFLLNMLTFLTYSHLLYLLLLTSDYSPC